jgi:hypothetical protein
MRRSSRSEGLQYGTHQTVQAVTSGCTGVTDPYIFTRLDTGAIRGAGGVADEFESDLVALGGVRVEPCVW